MKTGLKYSFVVFTVLYFVGLPFILDTSVLNYYIYIPVSLFFIYLSIHYFCYYCVLENDKIVKKYPGRLFSSTIEINLRDINYVEIKHLSRRSINIIFYSHDKKLISKLESVSNEDLLMLIPYLVEKNILIDINVLKDAIELRKLIRKLTKNYNNIKW
ncbi:MAG: hypothetical protein U0U66_12070 [Cytophagaceae bacterium]